MSESEHYICWKPAIHRKRYKCGSNNRSDTQTRAPTILGQNCWPDHTETRYSERPTSNPGYGNAQLYEAYVSYEFLGVWKCPCTYLYLTTVHNQNANCMSTMAKLTFCSCLHARSNVHGVTEETVFWHRVSYHSCIASTRTHNIRPTAHNMVQ